MDSFDYRLTGDINSILLACTARDEGSVRTDLIELKADIKIDIDLLLTH